MTDQLSSYSTSPNYVAIAADIISAFVSKNSVPMAELPALIGSVHAALRNVGEPAPQQEATKTEPPVPVKKSITPDFLISLEDGKRYKSLKRHLAKRGLTPEQYRAKWGLSANYPMVSPNYAAQRSELARSMGLGRKRKGGGAAKKTVSEASKKRRRKAA